MQAVRLLVDTRGRSYHVAWFGKHGATHRDLAPLLAVSPIRGWVPDFLSPPPRVPAPTLAAQLAEIRATQAGQVGEDLQRCYRTLTGKAREVVGAMLADPEAARDNLAHLIEVAWDELVRPFWAEIEELLDADVAYRSRQLADRGLRPMLEGIDPRIAWRGNGVHLGDSFTGTVDLGGRGLVLMPSAFSWPLVIAISDEPWQPTIAYPARGIAGPVEQASCRRPMPSSGCSAEDARHDPRRPGSPGVHDRARRAARDVPVRCVPPPDCPAGRGPGQPGPARPRGTLRAHPARRRPHPLGVGIPAADLTGWRRGWSWEP